MKFSDIKIIYHNEAPYANDAVSQLTKLLGELQDRVTETYAWKFTYNGKMYSHAISGTRKKPITANGIILLMEHMAKVMKRLEGENNA